MTRNRMNGPFDFFKKKKQAEQEAPRRSVHADADLYAILEVSPNASEQEIKSAYRRLAAKYHPDRNPDNPLVYQKFLDITKAHEILTDETQRQRYDTLRAANAEREPKKKVHYPSTYIEKGKRENRSTCTSKTPSREKAALAPWDVLFDPSPENAQPIYTSFPQSKPPGEATPPPWEVLFPGPVPVDFPSRETLLKAVERLPLKDIWSFVRETREDDAFQNVRRMVVGPLAGHSGRSIDIDVAELVGASPGQVSAYVERKGLDRAWVNILGPLSEQAVLAIQHLKPANLPGYFYADWAPDGQVLELLYTEPGS